MLFDIPLPLSSVRNHTQLCAERGDQVRAPSTPKAIRFVLVTHKHDIAEYAHRVIYIKDGVVERDDGKDKSWYPPFRTSRRVAQLQVW